MEKVVHYWRNYWYNGKSSPLLASESIDMKVKVVHYWYDDKNSPLFEKLMI